MRLLYGALALLLATAFYPLGRAWRANRRTTLRHAVAWSAAAWLAWVGAAALGVDSRLGRYLALSLTGCAGVAVLGARRPGATAWNFVVAALLAVLLWPVAEGLGQLRPNALGIALLACTMAVGGLNYLPTRLAVAVLAAGAACAAETCIVLQAFDPAAWDAPALALLAVAPWLGLAACRRTFNADELDREWLDFRDRFGAVWALPARDQFNRASANAGWGAVLEWKGLQAPPLRPADALAGLRAVLRRFRTDEEAPA